MSSKSKERVIIVKVPEDLYIKLEERAKALGYTFLADYIRYLLATALEQPPTPTTITPERIQIPEDTLVKTIERLIAEGKIHVEQLLEKAMAKIERRIFDKVNPFTSKVDSIARHQAELREVIEVIVERIKRLEERVSTIEKKITETISKTPTTRKKALEILKEQGVIFESDIAKKIKNRNLFFAKLERLGAKVIELKGERVAVDPDLWSKFVEKLREIRTNNEAEIRRRLSDKEFRLFKQLRESAIIYFDAINSEWKFVT